MSTSINTPNKEEMKTLSECIESLCKYGFEKSFRVENNVLKANDGERSYKPEEISIENFYRFEGESDPADSSILYAIQTNDGVKGTLSDAFGTYANSNVSDFMRAVEEIGKKHQPSDEKNQENSSS